jgi:hypothetical protein
MCSTSLRKAALKVCNAIYIWDYFAMCFNAVFLNVKHNFSFKAPHIISHHIFLCCFHLLMLSGWEGVTVG